MLKIVLMYVITLAAFTPAAAMDNKYFSLAKESFFLAVHLAESQDKDRIIENLKDCMSKNLVIKTKGYFSLPQEVQDLMFTYHVMILEKNYGIEPLRTSILDMRKEAAQGTDNKIALQKTYALYCKEFRKLSMLCDDNVSSPWCAKALKETATLLIESIECIENIKIKMFEDSFLRFEYCESETELFETIHHLQPKLQLK